MSIYLLDLWNKTLLGTWKSAVCPTSFLMFPPSPESSNPYPKLSAETFPHVVFSLPGIYTPKKLLHIYSRRHGKEGSQ